MKHLICILTLGLSLGASAAEFEVKVLNVDCHIKNGTVSRKQSFGRELEASFTETKKVQINGAEKLVEKALTLASTLPRTEHGMSYAVIVDGKKHFIEASDSLESEHLIRTLNKICR